ncbi:MAG: TetR/AcrR family transcriptional regulator [Flavobacterium sp.]
MKEKIIAKATDLFLKLGFKSITMDDLAGEMCISKKTIYKFFGNKEILIAECTDKMHKLFRGLMQDVAAKKYNPIEENFEIRKIFKTMFNVTDTSPLYQLRKYYPDIYEKVLAQENLDGIQFMRDNLNNGIEQEYYRKDINVEMTARLYFILCFAINESITLEKESQKLEYAALEYHTRSIATEKGILELDKQLSIHL